MMCLITLVSGCSHQSGVHLRFGGEAEWSSYAESDVYASIGGVQLKACVPVYTARVCALAAIRSIGRQLL